MDSLKYPQILTGYDLVSGDVMFAGETGWLRDHRQAKIAFSKTDAATLLAKGAEDMKANLMIDVYLVDIILSPDGHPEPIHYREKIRTRGPSIRQDLGKQAEGTFIGDI